MLAKQKVESSRSKENSLIEDFILQLKRKSQKTKLYYENTLVDLHLFLGKEWNELSVTEYEGYLDYLKRVNTYKEISQSTLINKVKVITWFLRYLKKRALISKECVSPFEQYLRNQKMKMTSTDKQKPSTTKEQNHLATIVKEFLVFLDTNDYASIRYKKEIKSFHQFLESTGENINVFLEENKEKFLFEQISKYENMIASRVSREEIKLSTATSYLRAVQLFVKFLCSQRLVSKKYTIPIPLRGRAKRAEEFVPKERMIELMNAIHEYSNHVQRDLSIFLIILDTGCRPIEVSNLTLRDVDKVERTLSFECRKTERRKVKISKEVMDVINDYLDIRDEYIPYTDSLFVNYKGNPITPSSINTVFYLANVKAFGESLYPAKAFRHTYITNALEENSFERVAKAIGHKDWKSTYYYCSRSKKRLLTNTLDNSPLEEMR